MFTENSNYRFNDKPILLCYHLSIERRNERKRRPPGEEVRQKTDFGHAPPSAGDQAHTAALSDGKQEPASQCLPIPGREAPRNPIVNRSAREVETYGRCRQQTTILAS